MAASTIARASDVIFVSSGVCRESVSCEAEATLVKPRFVVSGASALGNRASFPDDSEEGDDDGVDHNDTDGLRKLELEWNECGCRCRLLLPTPKALHIHTEAVWVRANIQRKVNEWTPSLRKRAADDEDDDDDGTRLFFIVALIMMSSSFFEISRSHYCFQMQLANPVTARYSTSFMTAITRESENSRRNKFLCDIFNY